MKISDFARGVFLIVCLVVAAAIFSIIAFILGYYLNPQRIGKSSEISDPWVKFKPFEGLGLGTLHAPIMVLLSCKMIMYMGYWLYQDSDVFVPVFITTLIIVAATVVSVYYFLKALQKVPHRLKPQHNLIVV